jgi:hypothetical protein
VVILSRTCSKGKISRDLALARGAKFVIELKEGKAKGVINENSPLEVIAIIGSNQFGEQVLLEEIGMGRALPFASRDIPSKEPDRKRRYICARKRLFSMTEEQYLIVAPIVFGLLQLFVDTRTSKWQNGSSFPMYCRRSYFSKIDKVIYRGWRLKFWPRGLRFSVHRESFFARDVYWAELNLNQIIQNYLSGLAKFVGLRLSQYQREWKGRKEFSDLKGAREIDQILKEKSLPSYLLRRFLAYLPKGRNNPFLSHLANMIGWNGESKEERLAEKALPNHQFRLGNIQLRVTSGLERSKKGKKPNQYITFEVHSSKE